LLSFNKPFFFQTIACWFGSDGRQKKLPGKTSSVWVRSIRGAESCENLAS
jgi:hypothetical protein